MDKRIKDLFEWAEFELLDVQFAGNTASDATRERNAARELIYSLCLKFQEMLLDAERTLCTE